jgi:NADH:ubiquinone oxidoreductase subunit 6 (subunit J)
MNEVRAQASSLGEAASRSITRERDKAESNDRKGILLFSLAAGIIGGLCCLTPIVLVLLGLATVAAAADLGNVLYGDYRWVFRLAALIFLGAGLVVYFRAKGICTLDQAKRQRNRIINASLLILTAATGIYLFWTYVVLHHWGIAAGLPWAEYSDEYWAIPGTIIAFAAFSLLF